MSRACARGCARARLPVWGPTMMSIATHGNSAAPAPNERFAAARSGGNNSDVNRNTPKLPRLMTSADDVGAAELSVARTGTYRPVARALRRSTTMNATSADGGGGEAGFEDRRRAPSESLALISAKVTAEERGGGRRAGRRGRAVGSAAGSRRLRAMYRAGRPRTPRMPSRHVDVEHPLPGDVLGEEPAEQRSDREAGAPARARPCRWRAGGSSRRGRCGG